MKTALIIVLALMYLIGVWVICKLDTIHASVYGQMMEDKIRHHLVIFTMWLFSPIIEIGFLIHLLFHKD